MNNVRRLPLGRGHQPSRPNNLRIAERITQRERDPELDEILVAIAQSGLSVATVADRAGLAKQTIDYWFNRTYRPQNYTLNKVWDALGYVTIRKRK